MPSAVASPLLEVRRVSKQFTGVRALNDVSLRLDRGEVLAVVGENGAGKSTLMRIVAGVETPDAGEIRFDDRTVRFTGVRDALAGGIVLIHQELNLCENLSIAANLFLGREITRGGFLDRAVMHRQSRALLDRVWLQAAPGTLIAD